MFIEENRKFEIKRYISDMGNHFNNMLTDFIEDEDFDDKALTKTDVEIIFCCKILIPLLEEKPKEGTKNEILELQEFIKTLRGDFIKKNGYDDFDKKKIDFYFSKDVLISLFELDANAGSIYDDDGNQIAPSDEDLAKMNITRNVLSKDENLEMLKGIIKDFNEKAKNKKQAKTKRKNKNRKINAQKSK